MGNCLRSRHRYHEPLLLSEDEERRVTLGQDQPLLSEAVVWSSKVPITVGQLRGKRDTFWETAPVYDGRPEIWDALKAAAEAAEEGDYELAQAILSGASITLPTGRLTECYDELGSRYVIPPYCLSQPSNLIDPTDDKNTSTQSSSLRQRRAGGSSGGGESSLPPATTMTIKVRLATQPKDIKVSVLSTDRVRDLKRKLNELHSIDGRRITMLYSGRVLSNSTLLKDLDIPKGFVIQAIVT